MTGTLQNEVIDTNILHNYGSTLFIRYLTRQSRLGTMHILSRALKRGGMDGGSVMWKRRGGLDQCNVT